MEYLNTIKRHPGRIFMNSKRDEGSFEISFCVGSINIFTTFLGYLYHELLAWFMIKALHKQDCLSFTTSVSACSYNALPFLDKHTYLSLLYFPSLKCPQGLIFVPIRIATHLQQFQVL